MGNTVLGVVAPLPQGAWNSTTTYQKLSVVREGNSSYIAKSANVNIQPGVTDSWETYWMLLNEDGDTGQQGPQGETGVGVPDGGLKGYILVKRSQDNYDDEWVDPDNITVGNATKALQDENGNNIADTYQTKQDSTTQNTALQTQITSNTQGITQNSQLISRNSARLTNVEQRISPSPFVKDSTVAYVKDVPANALPYAELQKLGGMTYRVNLGTDDAPNYVLRSAPVTSVESVGVNLFGGDALADKIVENFVGTKDEVSKTVSFNSANSNSKPIYSNFKEATRYTFILRIKNDVMARTNLVIDYADGTYEQLPLSTTGAFVKIVVTSAVGKTVKRFVTTYSGGVTVLRYDECGIFEGVLTLDDFKPYTKSTLPIPEAVQALDGYGDGINESVYNYITWNLEGNVKTYTKAVGVVDMGTLNWTFNGIDIFYVNMNLKKINMNNILCSKYPNANTWADNMADKTVTGNASNTLVYVRDSAYTDATAFKNAMSGVMLYYELATPEVTDISALITADNLLPVQGNGTITFVNEYGYAVPSTVEYMT